MRRLGWMLGALIGAVVGYTVHPHVWLVGLFLGAVLGWVIRRVGDEPMAVVVAKRFLVDLSNIGTVQRIVSFIGVGVLMLVIGYLSPVPPRSPEQAR